MPGVLKAKVDGNWVPVGGAMPDVLHTGPSAPTDPLIELWVDTDETVPPSGGVPAGGAINSILSKKTAADYDVQWTADPILTSVTITGNAWLKSDAQHMISYDAAGKTLFLGYALPANGFIDMLNGAGAGAYAYIRGNTTITGQLNLNKGQSLVWQGITGIGVDASNWLLIGQTATYVQIYPNMNVGSTGRGGILARNTVRAFGVTLTNGGANAGHGWSGFTRTGVGQIIVNLTQSLGQAVVFACPWGGNGRASGSGKDSTSIYVNLYDAAGNLVDGYVNFLIMCSDA